LPAIFRAHRSFLATRSSFTGEQYAEAFVGTQQTAALSISSKTTAKNGERLPVRERKVIERT
jgi:hypothetical protein